MAGYEIRAGRKYLIFDDPILQKFYDALFELGNPESRTPFDVNSAADLARVGIIDPASPEAETVVFPMRFDMDKIDREQKIDKVPSGYNSREIVDVLGYYTPEEKESYQRLKESNPELWMEQRKMKEEFVAEGYLRRNIRRMMEGHVVLMDSNHKDYPQALNVQSNDRGIKIRIENIPENMPEDMPEEPEKPTLYGLVKFFYNIFGWGKETVEPYERELKAYNDKVALFHEKDTARRVTQKMWPEYASQGKKIVPAEPDKIKIAANRIYKVEDALRQSKRNLRAVFGPEPAMQPGMKTPFQGVIDSIDKNVVAKPVKGITSDQSAAFTHLAMMNPKTMEDFVGTNSIFEAYPDHPYIKNRGAQLFSASGHAWDIQVGRDDMTLYTKEHPNGSITSQGHLVAKQAYELWGGPAQDPSLMGKVLADGLPGLTLSLCRSLSGITDSYMATMEECENIYAMMQEHPELQEAAVAQGLTNDTLRDMEANHNIYQMIRKGAKAEKQLLTDKNLSLEETRSLVADSMMLEYIGNMLVDEQVAVDKEILEKEMDVLRAPMEKLVAEGKEETDKIEAQIKKTEDPEEKARLEKMRDDIQKKSDKMVSLEAGLLSERIGAREFMEPSSAKYHAMSSPKNLEAIRNIIKDSPVVDYFANRDSKDCAAELARVVGKDTSPEYKRLHVEMTKAIYQKVISPVEAVSSAKQVNAPVAEKTNEKSRVL